MPGSAVGCSDTPLLLNCTFVSQLMAIGGILLRLGQRRLDWQIGCRRCCLQPLMIPGAERAAIGGADVQIWVRPVGRAVFLIARFDGGGASDGPDSSMRRSSLSQSSSESGLLMGAIERFALP